MLGFSIGLVVVSLSSPNLGHLFAVGFTFSGLLYYFPFVYFKKSFKAIGKLNVIKSNSNLKFKEVMKKFQSSAAAAYEKLDSRFKRAEESYEKAVTLYGEDVKTMAPDEFFGIFWTFYTGFTTAKTENETAIQKEEELRKREAEKKEREDKRKQKREGMVLPKDKVVGDQQGGLDDLISAIRSGKAFGEPRGNTLRKKPGTLGVSETKKGPLPSDSKTSDLKRQIESLESSTLKKSGGPTTDAPKPSSPSKAQHVSLRNPPPPPVSTSSTSPGKAPGLPLGGR